MELDVRANINRIKFSSVKFISRALQAVFKCKILKVAFSGLITYRTIKRMVDEQQFHDAPSCFKHFW